MKTWIIKQDKEYLVHHGIKGQRWGIRRYQNEDGSLTDEGKKRYYTDDEIKKDLGEYMINSSTSKKLDQVSKELDKMQKKYELDADDFGGGNKEFRENKKAQAKLNKLLDEHDKLFDKLDKEGQDYIKNKYGDKRIQELYDNETKEAGKTLLKGFGIMGGIFAGLVGLSVGYLVYKGVR